MLLDALEVTLSFLRIVAERHPAASPGLDLGWIASHVDAVPAQDLDLVLDLRDRAEPVPHVGVSGGGAQRPLLAAAADHDREALLHGTHEDFGVHQLVVAPHVRHALAVDELADDPRRFGEAPRA